MLNGRKFIRVNALTILFVITLISTVKVQAKDRLTIGIVPSESMTSIVASYEPFAAYISHALGKKVDLYISNDYTGIIEAMRFGHVDIAYFGAFSYVLAHTEAGVKAFAGIVVDGSRSYKSVIITNVNSSIYKLDDLRGVNFGFVDPASGSGYLYPLALLKNNGINPEKDFSAVVFSGGHDSLALAVLNRHLDAGATAETLLPKFLSEKELKNIRIIARSEPILHACFAVAANITEEEQSRISSVFIEMYKDKEGNNALSKIGVVRLVNCTDADYNPTREVAKVLNLDLSKQR